MKKAIILDMDGTIWDSSIRVLEAWNIIIKQHNCKEISLTDLQDCMGLPMDAIFIKLFSEMDGEKRKILRDECEEFENEYLKTHPGVVYEGLADTLSTLSRRGFEIMIVTNAQSGYVEAFFEGTGLGHLFSDYEQYGNTLLPKSENIKLIMKRNSVDSAVYVGDTQLDCNSAGAAGVPFIFAKYGFGSVEKYQYSIEHPSDLIEIVEKIF